MTRWPSIRQLKQATGRWFREVHDSEPWYVVHPGTTAFPKERARAGEPIDVVLMGDFARQICHSAGWPPEADYRLWLLGSAAREVATRVLGVSADQVGVIPRYELFPILKKPRPFPKPGEPWTAVYAGRLCASKNFGMVLRVVSFLQTEFRVPVELVVYGPEMHEGMDGYEAVGDPNERRAHALAAKLPWVRKPKFSGRLAPGQWSRRGLRNPVLMNFSLSHMDDFGVAVAQAQAEGWPCILSDWGGHRDAAGPNVMRFPPDFIGTAAESDSLRRTRAFSIASEIAKGMRPDPPARIPVRHFSAPRPIGSEGLEAVRAHLSEQYSPRILDWSKRKMPMLRWSDGGRSFFFRYRQCFAPKPEANRRFALIISSACDGEVCESMKTILPMIQQTWGKAFRRMGHRVRNLKSRGPKMTEAVLEASKADLVVIDRLDDKAAALVLVLRKELGCRAPLMIHIHGEGAYEGLVQSYPLIPVLTSRDVFITASEADARVLRCGYPNADVRTIPFPRPVMPTEQPGIAGHRIRRFFYVARKSEQRNLHSLLFAFKLLVSRLPGERLELHVFGAPDHGSSVMGIAGVDYSGFLKRRVVELGLGSAVKWRGFLDQARLCGEIRANPHVFVGASLHMGEDFGVEVFSSLMAGNPALLTAWGGHRDFKRRFRSRVFPITVYGSRSGPFISPVELAEVMKESLSFKPEAPRSLSRFARWNDSISGEYAKVASGAFKRKSKSSDSLEIAPFVRTLLRRYGDPRKRRRMAQGIYAGFGDPLALPALRAYGMKDPRIPGGSFALLLPPWVRVGSGRLRIADAHRRACLSLRIAPADSSENGVELFNAGRMIERVSPRFARKLIENGWAFPLRGVARGTQDPVRSDDRRAVAAILP